MHELVLNSPHWSDWEPGEPLENCDCEEPLRARQIDYAEICSPALVRNVVERCGWFDRNAVALREHC